MSQPILCNGIYYNGLKTSPLSASVKFESSEEYRQKLILNNTNMAPCKWQVKVRRHLVCDHCTAWFVFYLVWMRKVLGTDNGGRVFFSVHGVSEGTLPKN